MESKEINLNVESSGSKEKLDSDMIFREEVKPTTKTQENTLKSSQNNDKNELYSSCDYGVLKL